MTAAFVIVTLGALAANAVFGFVPVPALKRGFSSNGQENKSSIVDLDTLKTIEKVVTVNGPTEVDLELSK